MATRPKFIQITSCYRGEEYTSPTELYALDEDGGVWQFIEGVDGGDRQPGWMEISDLRGNERKRKKA